MKKLSTLLLALSLVLCTLFALTLNASAASTEVQNGLEVTITTDKADYNVNEDITVTVSVKNNNQTNAENLSIQTLLPEGLVLKSGNLVVNNIDVQAQSTYTTTVVAVLPGQTEPEVKPDDDKTDSPQTGEHDIVIIAAVAAFSAAGIALMLKSKKSAKVMSMFLCLVMIAAVLPANTFAAEDDTVITVDTAVKVNGTSYTITAKVTANPIADGTLTGKICKASDHNSAIADATIEIYKGETLINSTKSDATGNYAFTLPAGQYLLKITSTGYIEFKAFVVIVSEENTYVETFLLIAESEAESGSASGTIVDSFTGKGEGGISLKVKKGWNNTSDASENVAEGVTDANGGYSFNLPLGNYTVIASKDDFTSSSFNIIVQEGTTNDQNGTITPIATGNDYLITLTWGVDPRDLDSHVEGTLSNGDSFHVYFSHKSQYDGLIEVCNLDYDDTSSYGPEHITLSANTDKPYYYYIYKYAGNGTVANSRAKITVERGNVLIAQFNVPTNLGSADYWNVFAIKDGKLIINNTITSSPNLTYAN